MVLHLKSKKQLDSQNRMSSQLDQLLLATCKLLIGVKAYSPFIAMPEVGI